MPSKSRYQDMTESLAERWVEQIESARERQISALERFRELTERMTPDLPEMELPFSDTLTQALPSPLTVAKANFKLAAKVLEAQKRYTVDVLEAWLGQPKPKGA